MSFYFQILEQHETSVTREERKKLYCEVSLV